MTILVALVLVAAAGFIRDCSLQIFPFGLSLSKPSLPFDKLRANGANGHSRFSSGNGVGLWALRRRRRARLACLVRVAARCPIARSE